MVDNQNHERGAKAMLDIKSPWMIECEGGIVDDPSQHHEPSKLTLGDGISKRSPEEEIELAREILSLALYIKDLPPN
jgi:hypothetical protein